MVKGKTFLTDDKTPSGIVIKHLHIVISDPMEFGEDKKLQCLVVNATTWHEEVRSQDPSCILPDGCHPFIKHKSWIDYSRSEPMTFAKIFNGLKHDCLFIQKEDMPPDVLASIQEGAKVSDNFPEDLKQFFHAF